MQSSICGASDSDLLALNAIFDLHTIMIRSRLAWGCLKVHDDMIGVKKICTFKFKVQPCREKREGGHLAPKFFTFLWGVGEELR